VWCFTDALTPAQLKELAQHTERLSYGALWYVEAFGYESFSLGGFLLNQTETLIIAAGIANIYARDATAMKQGQHSLAKFSGGRFLLGMGVSHRPLVEDVRGHHYGRPIATMRAYLDAMEKATAVVPALEDPPPNSSGRVRSQDDGTGHSTCSWGLVLQCHPPAHGAGARDHWSGQMALRRAKGSTGQRPYQGARDSASGDGCLHSPAQLPK
jgi:alkanesulfonate monooxygenase SsuD/methylene tetrahydromethanopterin reductase-like flavin-dependent oxidoreductase (luciferase family)